jgi:tRNA (guanine-N7-)-methyltransferase
VIEQQKLDNIRIWNEDALDLVRRLPKSCLARVYILYPDPWPKWRQRKRRIISDENLQALARVMQQGAELRFATDIDDYSAWALERVMRSPDFIWRAEKQDDWLHPWEGWPSTRYETKALREGRKPAYLTFERK